jgi:trehalose-6-phosphatase
VTGALERISADLPGTHVERKAFAAALHTRPALEAGRPETFARARAATSALRNSPGVHLTEGSQALEFSVRTYGRPLATGCPAPTRSATCCSS